MRRTTIGWVVAVMSSWCGSGRITGRTLRGVRGADGHGWFVTLEGPEGSGKTTQAELLAAAARTAGLDVVLTREPGGTRLGERIRSVLLDDATVLTDAIDARTETLLFNAARAQLVAEVIEPAIGRGALVVCARFADSTVAYQGYGLGLDTGELRAIERFATHGLRPDLTILLDLPVAAGLERKGADETTRFEALDVAFHERVRRGFLRLADEERGRFVVVDGLRPPDDVLRDVRAAAARLPGLERLSDPAPDPARMRR
jgi:dTMP kinase